VGRHVSDLADPAFQAAFTGLRRSWFRLECLQEYDAPSEREMLRAFLAGEPRPASAHHEAWTAKVRTHVDGGRSLRRVHVVEEPLTDYLRFELSWGYAAGVAGGEDVRVIPVRRGDWPAELTRQDYWLFDDEVAWLLHYDDRGRVTGAELVDDQAELDRYLDWRDVAVGLSVSLADYTAGARLRRVS
jgi:hypothetical protein